jgi:hypothetical protein
VKKLLLLGSTDDSEDKHFTLLLVYYDNDIRTLDETDQKVFQIQREDHRFSRPAFAFSGRFGIRLLTYLSESLRRKLHRIPRSRDHLHEHLVHVAFCRDRSDPG